MHKPRFDTTQKAVVLMVEDNLDHAFLAREAFEECSPHVALHHVTSGDLCMDWLRREPPYQDAPWPDLILLDLHMPRMDGFEVMQAIRKDPALAALVVIVLTTSAEVNDVDKMYRLGCNSYVQKSGNYLGWEEMVKTLDSYWLHLTHLPSGEQL